MKLSHFHISLPKEGEQLSGDAVVVREKDGTFLFAVIDSLGHGPVASIVADRARAYLATAPLDRDVRYLMEGLHGALRGTRGAAGMCCLVRKGRIEGCGIGNVELRVLKNRVPVVLTPGILGVSTLRARIFEGSVSSGARLLMFSDGISPRMDMERTAKLSAEEACRSLVERYRRAHDDASLLIIDVHSIDLGPGPSLPSV
ncbi:MAG: SpoIIE family protein phosphatase [Polyangiaceae bacterium]